MIFPALRKHNLSRLTLIGFLESPVARVRRYWSSKGLRFDPESDLLSLDSEYLKGGVKYYRRLYFHIEKQTLTRVVIDLSVKPLPKVKPSYHLTDSRFISFCRWIFMSDDAKPWHFMLKTTHRLEYKSSMRLPFNPNPKGDQYVKGIVFGFSHRRSIQTLRVQKNGDVVVISMHTKPVFRLDPKYFNTEFFDSVLRHADAPIKGILGGRTHEPKL